MRRPETITQTERSKLRAADAEAYAYLVKLEEHVSQTVQLVDRMQSETSILGPPSQARPPAAIDY